MGRKTSGYVYRLRGKGNWRVRWTADGKRHDVSTGTEDYEKAKKIANQKTSAYAMLGDVRTLTAELEKAKDEQAYLEAKTNPSLTLGRMIEAFKSCDIIRRRNNAEATIRSWTNVGNILVYEFGAETEMRQITREQAETFMRGYEKKVNSVTFNHALAFFKRVWTTLKKYDSPTELKARLPNDTPWDYILPMKRTEVIGKQALTKEQLTRIWRVLDEMGDEDLTLLFDLGRNTGARLHDCCSFKWDENLKFITNDNRFEAILEWKPIKTKSSSGKMLCIPIIDERVVAKLWDRYNLREAGEDFVLPEIHRAYLRNKACSLSKKIQSVFIKAGIKTKVKVDGNARSNCVYGFHSFRHTLATELFNNGVDLATIAYNYTGHGSSAMANLYSHASMDKKRKELSSLTRIEIEEKKPTESAIKTLHLESQDDMKAYDFIETMSASVQVKIFLRTSLQFKSVEDLTIIRDFLTNRIKTMKK